MPKTPPRLTLTVQEDPVTGTWTFTLHGHQIEIERAHGFVKVDGILHRASFVQDLREIDDLAGVLDALTHLLPTPPSTPAHWQAEEQAPLPPPAPQTTPQAPPHETSKPQTTRPKKTTRATPPQTRDAEERVVLSTNDAAAYLGISPATLETQRTRGGGPPFLKLGRRVVYRKSDLDTWLAARVRRSTSDPGPE